MNGTRGPDVAVGAYGVLVAELWILRVAGMHGRWLGFARWAALGLLVLGALAVRAVRFVVVGRVAHEPG